MQSTSLGVSGAQVMAEATLFIHDEGFGVAHHEKVWIVGRRY